MNPIMYLCTGKNMFAAKYLICCNKMYVDFIVYRQVIKFAITHIYFMYKKKPSLCFRKKGQNFTSWQFNIYTTQLYTYIYKIQTILGTKYYDKMETYFILFSLCACGIHAYIGKYLPRFLLSTLYYISKQASIQ